MPALEPQYLAILKQALDARFVPFLPPFLGNANPADQAAKQLSRAFNALTFHLLDSDAIAFGTEVLALMDALIDHEASWPKNGKQGSYWATGGETRRLHPLRKPS